MNSGLRDENDTSQKSYYVRYPQISSMDQALVDKDHLKGKGVEEAFRILSEEVLARLEVDTKHLQFSRLSKIYLYVNSIIKGKNMIQ